MTDFASDYEALFRLIETEGNELKGVDPEHEILQFFEPILQNEKWGEQRGQAFLERFDPNEDKTVVGLRVAYYKALRVANGKPEIDTPKLAPKPKPPTALDLLLEEFDNDIPF